MTRCTCGPGSWPAAGCVRTNGSIITVLPQHFGLCGFPGAEAPVVPAAAAGGTGVSGVETVEPWLRESSVAEPFCGPHDSGRQCVPREGHSLLLVAPHHPDVSDPWGQRGLRPGHLSWHRAPSHRQRALGSDTPHCCPGPGTADRDSSGTLRPFLLGSFSCYQPNSLAPKRVWIQPVPRHAMSLPSMCPLPQVCLETPTLHLLCEM